MRGTAGKNYIRFKDIFKCIDDKVGWLFEMAWPYKAYAHK